MTIKTSSVFDKAYKRRVSSHPKLVEKVRNRLEIFKRDPHNLVLRDHPLQGSLFGYRSFSITGDIRIVYEKESEDTITLVDIGTHNQVY